MVANEREGKSERLPEHLYELGDGEWGLWRWVVLRGAGFAVREVLGLAAAEAAAAADRVTAAETAAAARLFVTRRSAPDGSPHPAPAQRPPAARSTSLL